MKIEFLVHELKGTHLQSGYGATRAIPPSIGTTEWSALRRDLRSAAISGGNLLRLETMVGLKGGQGM